MKDCEKAQLDVPLTFLSYESFLTVFSQKKGLGTYVGAK